MYIYVCIKIDSITIGTADPFFSSLKKYVPERKYSSVNRYNYQTRSFDRQHKDSIKFTYITGERKKGGFRVPFSSP